MKFTEEQASFLNREMIIPDLKIDHRREYSVSDANWYDANIRLHLLEADEVYDGENEETISKKGEMAITLSEIISKEFLQ